MPIEFTVTEVRNLNLLGINAIQKLNISIDSLLCINDPNFRHRKTNSVLKSHSSDTSLQDSCSKLCAKVFPIYGKQSLDVLQVLS